MSTLNSLDVKKPCASLNHLMTRSRSCLVSGQIRIKRY